MKNLIILLLLLFSCNAIKYNTVEDQGKLTLSQFNLKGRVELVSEYNYSLSKFSNIHSTFPKNDTQLNSVEVDNFDSLGYINHINNKKYLNASSLSDSAIYIIFGTNDNIYKNKYAYKYNSRHNKIERDTYRQDTLTEKEVSIYDNNDNNDNNDNLAEQDIYNPNGSLRFKMTFNYNKNGRSKEVFFLIPNDRNYSSRTVYEYDDKGNITTINSYGLDNRFFQKITFKHDDKGNEIEKCMYKTKDNLENKMVTRYDDYGNVVEKVMYKPDGSLESKSVFKYEDYDKNGNYLKETIFRNDTPVSIIKREIAYY